LQAAQVKETHHRIVVVVAAEQVRSELRALHLETAEQAQRQASRPHL
jgi:hypothetical protein